MTPTLTDDDRKALAADIRGMIQGRGFHGLEDIEASFKRYMSSVEREAEHLQLKAREDGRDRLHADDQRRMDKLSAEAGILALEVAGLKEVALQTRANRERLLEQSQRQGASSGAYGWKSVIPSMAEYKAQSIGNDPGGGYLVNAEVGGLFDRLRPQTVVLAAGPRIETITSDAIELPGIQSSTTPYATAENGDITESSLAFHKVRVPVKKYASWSRGSSEWFSDAMPSARQIIENDHRLQLAAKIDQDMLQGGSNGAAFNGESIRQRGTATALATAGATPTFDNILDALYRMEANNAKPSAIFMHPRSWNSLRKAQDAQDRYQLQPDPTQEARQSLFGLPVYLSSQISITEDSGNGANHDCSWIAVVDMSHVVVVRRAEAVVLFDPFTYAKNDQIAVRTTTRWGMGVLHTAAVEVLTGVRP